MIEDSDSMPLPEADLTPDERKALRKLLRDDERASWAWKQLRVIAPAVVAVAVGAWQLWDWFVRHVKVTP